MFILGDVIITVANVIHIIFSLYQVVIFVAVIMSWIRPNPQVEFVRTILIVITRLTEPVFSWVRQKLPKSFLSLGIDFTPIIVLIAVYAADSLLYRILMNIGIRLSLGATTPDSPQDLPLY